MVKLQALSSKIFVFVFFFKTDFFFKNCINLAILKLVL